MLCRQCCNLCSGQRGHACCSDRDHLRCTQGRQVLGLESSHLSRLEGRNLRRSQRNKLVGCKCVQCCRWQGYQLRCAQGCDLLSGEGHGFGGGQRGNAGRSDRRYLRAFQDDQIGGLKA